MKITLGRVLSVVALVAAVALAVWALLPKPIPVEVAMVTKGNFVATVDEDGKTRVRERYVVAAPLPGRLTRVRLKAGDAVKAGENITAIVPAPAPFLDPRRRREQEERLGTAEATRERTKAMVERAQAQTAQAKKDLDRIRTLTETGSSTAQALERAETAMRVANRELRAAEFQDHATEHEIEQAKALLAQYGEGGTAPPDRWNVTAPVSGLVLKVTAGERNQSCSQARRFSKSAIRATSKWSSTCSALMPSKFDPARRLPSNTGADPGTLAGRVRRVEPAAFTKISTLGVEEQRVNVLVDIVLAADGIGQSRRCLSGRHAHFGVHAAMMRRSFRPARCSALGKPGTSTSRKTDERNAAQWTLLRRSGRFAALTAGVEVGDRVIVYPSDRVAPGLRVDVR